MTSPQANRPQYSTGGPVPDQVDASTKEWSRGVNPATGAKGPEPAEPVPTVATIAPTSGPAAGGTAVVLTGDNFGGSTGVTIGGTAATGLNVVSERELRCITGARAAGAGLAIVVLNPAGNSTGGPTYTYV